MRGGKPGISSTKTEKGLIESSDFIVTIPVKILMLINLKQNRERERERERDWPTRNGVGDVGVGCGV